MTEKEYFYFDSFNFHSLKARIVGQKDSDKIQYKSKVLLLYETN